MSTAGIVTALGFVAEKFLSALLSKASGEVLGKLDRDLTKVAFQEALGSAIQRYTLSGGKLLLAGPLLEESKNFLAEESVANELAETLLFARRPDAEVIGEQWKAAMINPPYWCDFTTESQLLLHHFEDALRSSGTFRPVFVAKDISRIAQSVDSADDTLADILASLRNLQEVLQSEFGRTAQLISEASPGIRERIRDQSQLIDEKTRGFVGRRFVFEAIDQFVGKANSGYFIVRGDPGIGKSAMAAQLVKMRGYVHHFNVRAEGINSAGLFLRNTCAQLISRYGLKISSPPPEASQDSGFLKQLLTEISNMLTGDERLVIVVDGLDEVDTTTQPEGTNILMFPRSLPERVFVVATSRRDTIPLQIECEMSTFDIEQDDAGNISDIGEFLKAAVNRRRVQLYLSNHEISVSEFVQTLAAKSQGNFMYLHYVIPEIARGRYQKTDFDDLPLGLMAYYEDHWRQMKGKNVDDWFAHKLPVIMALTVIKEPVSIDMISEFSGVAERPRIRSVLQDWWQFLSEETVECEEHIQKRYRMYHASFHDFISQKEQVKDERVNMTEAHKRIADSMWSDLFRSESSTYD